jgi:hypothetical protein
VIHNALGIEAATLKKIVADQTLNIEPRRIVDEGSF